jgi:putative membrane protein insertion efficiency factor
MKHLFILLIKIYQKTLSPMFGDRCKYFPSCSHYAVDAFVEHGAIKGLALTAWRLLRCNPWSHGGVDYVSTAEKSSTRTMKNTKKPVGAH